MRAVDDKAPPPQELRMAWMCRSWNALPDTGAMLDQDYILIMRMQTLLNVYEAMSAMRGARGDDIHRLSPHHSKVLASLVNMGIGLGIGG